METFLPEILEEPMEAIRRVALPIAGGCLALGSMVFISPLAWTADLTIPKTFVPGTPATAADVNQNFSATATSVNSKQDRVNGVCPAGQAVLSINANGSVVCDTNLNNRVTTIETSLLAVTDYRPVGPQTNVMALQVALGGWTICYSELYNATTGVLTNILAACNKANLMLACRPVGTNTYGVLAQAPRADVIFATPADATTVHVANGTAWYFNTSFSWGFAKAVDTVNKNSCDFQDTIDNEQRLCWHTGAGNLSSGYRCGVSEGLFNTAWQRVVMHRD
jgi:hypothetical protein